MTGQPDVVEQIVGAGLSSPRRLTVAVARGCNLRCGHCYVESAPESAAPDPPAEAVCQLLIDFERLGGREVCLTGGEPLGREDWFELLSFACRRPDFDVVILQTNASLLDDGVARAIASLRCGHLRIQVSLEGASDATHDRLRGPGSFARSLRGISALTENGLAGQVSVAFTETRHNIGELPEVLELLEGLGVRRLTSASVTPHGRAKESEAAASPEPWQYRWLVERYGADQRFRERCASWAEVTALKWWEGRHCPTGSVCTLVRNPYLSTDGSLYPCPLLHAPEFAVKAAWTRPLAESLAQGVPPWAALQRTSERRAREISECRTCVGLGHCGGGCMGRAYMANGILLAPEDRCELRKAVYS